MITGNCQLELAFGYFVVVFLWIRTDLTSKLKVYKCFQLCVSDMLFEISTWTQSASRTRVSALILDIVIAFPITICIIFT